MNLIKLRRKIKNKKWVKDRLNKLYKESEFLDRFKTFECSEFFRGKISANRNITLYEKAYKQNVRHINFLERCK